MTGPELVFAENSPYDSVEAIIEQDENVAFFYLRSVDEKNRFGMKSCWIRNLRSAPDVFEMDSLKNGIPPMLPREACRHPEGQDRLQEKRLRVVWLAEGDGAALLEDDQCLAVIPAWSGTDGFHGYSRDCLAESPLCSPLSAADGIQARIADADSFWKSWESDESPWTLEQPKLLAAFEKKFGAYSQYYSIDGERWPPKALLRFETEAEVILVTLGVSLCPQPQLELHFDHSGLMRRIEFACCFSRSVSETTLNSMMRYMSGQSSLPWNQLTFLAHGHTVSCEALLKDEQFPDFSSVLLWENQHSYVDKIKSGDPSSADVSGNRFLLPSILGDPVNLLWMIPVFENERRAMSQNGPELLAHKIIGDHEFPVVTNRGVIL